MTPASAPPACPLCAGERWRMIYETTADGAAARFWPARSCFAHWLCADCGLVRQNPLPGEARLARFYESYRCFHDAVGGFLTAASRRRVTFLRSAWGGQLEGADVLDVGCGGGDLLRLLRDEGAEVLGLELSPAAGAQAERGDVPVRYGGLAAVSAGETFDLVCSITVLEHLRDPLAAVRAMGALVRPGGALLLEVPSLARPRVGVADFLCYQHLYHFVPETFRGLLALAGLAVVAVDEDAPHSVAVLARADGSVHAAWRPDPRVAARVVVAIDDYRRRRDLLFAGLTERLAPVVDGARRVVVYGAGDHTAQLLAAFPALAQVTVAFVDSDPLKQGSSFAGRPVRAPGDLDDIAADAVLLSSQPFQEEMAATVARFDSRGLDVVRLYPRPEDAGP